MDIKFGVAISYHCAGAPPENLREERFMTYDRTNEFAERFRDECKPTIYVIVDDKYAFYCERSAVANRPYKIFNLRSFKGGEVETRVWWRDFWANPEKFLHLAVGIRETPLDEWKKVTR